MHVSELNGLSLTWVIDNWAIILLNGGGICGRDADPFGSRRVGSLTAGEEEPAATLLNESAAEPTEYKKFTGTRGTDAGVPENETSVPTSPSLPASAASVSNF